jgi:hypothetical protein
MSSNGWITDRLPTEQDADDFFDVWITHPNGYVCEWNWRSVKPQMPWQPTNKPAPYVKPKRWTVEWCTYLSGATWELHENGNSMFCLGPHISKDAAQRICDIYNEVMP